MYVGSDTSLSSQTIALVHGDSCDHSTPNMKIEKFYASLKQKNSTTIRRQYKLKLHSALTIKTNRSTNHKFCPCQYTGTDNLNSKSINHSINQLINQWNRISQPGVRHIMWACVGENELVLSDIGYTHLLWHELPYEAYYWYSTFQTPKIEKYIGTSKTTTGHWGSQHSCQVES